MLQSQWQKKDFHGRKSNIYKEDFTIGKINIKRGGFVPCVNEQWSFRLNIERIKENETLDKRN